MSKNFNELAVERSVTHNAAYAEELAAVSTVEATEKAARAFARADWRKAIRSGLAKDHAERLASVFTGE